MKHVLTILAIVFGLVVPVSLFCAAGIGFDKYLIHPAPVVEVVVEAPVVVAPMAVLPPTLEEVVAATVTIKCVGEGNREWAGSGSFIDANGTILTAGHVLDGAVVVMVILGDGKIYPAVDPFVLKPVDVGFCKMVGPLPTPFLKIAPIATRLGDTVRVIGSPMGLIFAGSVSQGIVSCTMRMHDKVEYLQVDASAIPGNSGGPVVNLQGEIVGVLVAGIQAGIEINFAVPADQVLAVLDCYNSFKKLKAVLWHPQPQPQN
jgi:S1-C subfamily serine protease